MPVLAEEAVEGAGIIKYRQVLISILRTIGIGELRIAGATSGRTDPVGDTVSGQRVPVPVHRCGSPLTPQRSELPLSVLPDAAKSLFPNPDAALVDADITSHTAFGARRLRGEFKFSSALGVKLPNVREKSGKFISQALIAQPEKRGDGALLFTAIYTFSLFQKARSFIR